MSMGVSESTAVNHVLRFLLEQYEGDTYVPDQVLSAAKLLAISANKRLGAGIRPEQIPTRKAPA